MWFGNSVLLLSGFEPGHSPGTMPGLWQEVIYELMSGFINLQGRHAGNLIDSSHLPRAGFPGWELDLEAKRALEVTRGTEGGEKRDLVKQKHRKITM